MWTGSAPVSWVPMATPFTLHDTAVIEYSPAFVRHPSERRLLARSFPRWTIATVKTAETKPLCRELYC